jgi:hypothetical protein
VTRQESKQITFQINLKNFDSNQLPSTVTSKSTTAPTLTMAGKKRTRNICDLLLSKLETPTTATKNTPAAVTKKTPAAVTKNVTATVTKKTAQKRSREVTKGPPRGKSHVRPPPKKRQKREVAPSIEPARAKGSHANVKKVGNDTVQKGKQTQSAARKERRSNRYVKIKGKGGSPSGYAAKRNHHQGTSVIAGGVLSNLMDWIPEDQEAYNNKALLTADQTKNYRPEVLYGDLWTRRDEKDLRDGWSVDDQVVLTCQMTTKKIFGRGQWPSTEWSLQILYQRVLSSL